MGQKCEFEPRPPFALAAPAAGARVGCRGQREDRGQPERCQVPALLVLHPRSVMRTKRCSYCRKTKPVDQFHRRSNCASGCQSRCKECRYKTVDQAVKQTANQQWRTKNSVIHNAANQKWRANNRAKTRAHKLLDEAVKNGDLERPDTCERCGLKSSRALHGHHRDYSRPLEVLWLCAKCHGAEHHGSTTNTQEVMHCDRISGT
jgi:hypothetical protein